LQEIDGPVDRGTAFGRAALGCSEAELPGIQSLMEEKKETILTPLVSLDTPGKATVQVVIVADPVIFFRFFEIYLISIISTNFGFCF